MSTITDLEIWDNWSVSRWVINTNFDNLNTDKLETSAYTDATTSAAGKTRLSVAPASPTVPIAVGDNDPRVPTVAQVGYIPSSTEKDALAGTGTPSGSNKFVTNDTLTAEITASTSQIVDTTYANGEAVTAWQAVFIESVPTFATATSVQNVGDVSGNTRISFPIFGTWVAGTTFNISLKKTVSPSATFSFRIETDNAGSPSGTIVTNGSGTITAASVTTSFVDTTLTLAGSVTLTSGVRYHMVLFAGTYGSETVNGTNYFNVGYNTNNTTTRPTKTWNGSVWSAVASTTFCYASSTIFNSRVLSLTDADFSYKIDWYGITVETKAVGLFPRITVDGINNVQSWLTYWSDYYLSGTPGAISTTSWISGILVGNAISTTGILLTRESKYSISTNLRNDWYTWQAPLLATSGTALAWWVANTTTVSQFTGAGGYTLVWPTTSAFSITTSLPGTGSTLNYSPSINKDIRIKVRLKMESSGSQFFWWGMCVTAANIYTAQTDVTNGEIRFISNTWVLYAQNANGTATSTNVSSGITLTDWNTYEIIFNPGVDIKYYINGALVATHTTNLPTTGTLIFAIGSNDSEDCYVYPINMSLEL